MDFQHEEKKLSPLDFLISMDFFDPVGFSDPHGFSNPVGFSDPHGFSDPALGISRWGRGRKKKKKKGIFWKDPSAHPKALILAGELQTEPGAWNNPWE